MTDRPGLLIEVVASAICALVALVTWRSTASHRCVTGEEADTGVIRGSRLQCISSTVSAIAWLVAMLTPIQSWSGLESGVQQAGRVDEWPVFAFLALSSFSGIFQLLSSVELHGSALSSHLRKTVTIVVLGGVLLLEMTAAASRILAPSFADRLHYAMVFLFSSVPYGIFGVCLIVKVGDESRSVILNLLLGIWKCILSICAPVIVSLCFQKIAGTMTVAGPFGELTSSIQLCHATSRIIWYSLMSRHLYYVFSRKLQFTSDKVEGHRAATALSAVGIMLVFAAGNLTKVPIATSAWNALVAGSLATIVACYYGIVGALSKIRRRIH